MQAVGARTPSAPARVIGFDALRGCVGVRELGADERAAYLQIPPAERSSWLVVRCAVDAAGVRQFTDGDLAWVPDLPAWFVGQVAAAARRLNALDVAFEEAAERLSTDDEARFAYRLALALGCPHPDFLRATMTSRQWVGWMTYAAVEPWGELRADYRAALLWCLTANLHRDEKKRSAPFLPQDVFETLTPREDPNTPEALAAAERLARRIAMQSGAAGLSTDLSTIPDAYLTPADRAKKYAQAGPVVVTDAE